MMKLLFVAFALLIAVPAMAKKSYSVSCKVLSLVTKNPVVGMKVILADGNRILGSQITDDEGMVVFNEIKAKSITVASSENSDYIGFYEYFDNKEKKDIEMQSFVRFSKEKAQMYFKDRETKYADEEGGFLEFLNDDPAKNNCDIDNVTEVSYPGGNIEFQRYIARNIQYPQESIEKNEQGRVYISFIVERTGEISHVKVEKSVSELLDLEALMLLYHAKDFLPCKCGDEPMRMRMRVPIRFTLN